MHQTIPCPHCGEVLARVSGDGYLNRGSLLCACGHRVELTGAPIKEHTVKIRMDEAALLAVLSQLKQLKGVSQFLETVPNASELLTVEVVQVPASGGGAEELVVSFQPAQRLTELVAAFGTTEGPANSTE